jgi:hypothetical protein
LWNQQTARSPRGKPSSYQPSALWSRCLCPHPSSTTPHWRSSRTSSQTGRTVAILFLKKGQLHKIVLVYFLELFSLVLS